VHHRIVSAVKRIEFISDRVSYIVLRGRWCNVIVLNLHSATDEKSDYSKDSFYEELEQVFNHFPKYHMKILLRDFNAKVGGGGGGGKYFKKRGGGKGLNKGNKKIRG